MQKKTDNDYMLNILLKENERLRQVIKGKQNINNNETIYDTINSMVDVLELQRNKIKLIEQGTIMHLYIVKIHNFIYRK